MRDPRAQEQHWVWPGGPWLRSWTRTNPSDAFGARGTRFSPPRGRTGDVRGGSHGGYLSAGRMGEIRHLKLGGRHLGLWLTEITAPPELRTAVYGSRTATYPTAWGRPPYQPYSGTIVGHFSSGDRPQEGWGYPATAGTTLPRCPGAESAVSQW